MQSDAEQPGEEAKGHLDGLVGDRIVGWAWCPASPEQFAIVELVAGETVIAVATAGIYRGDLAESGIRGGDCGFEFLAIDQFPRGVELKARVSTPFKSHALSGAVVLPMDAPAAADAISAPAHSAPQPVHRQAVSRTSVALAGPSGLVGHLEEFGPDLIRGWAFKTGDQRPVSLTIFEGDQAIATFEATAWRPDLAERRQGDGRCGIHTPLPDVLRDGQVHVVDLKLSGSGKSVLPHPLEVRAAPRIQSTPEVIALKRPPPSTPPLFSIIVNFYNMGREAERTLTSLSRAYQRNIDDIAYEVLCVDNGSREPLKREWVESFGPEFRLAPPSKILPSPCKAINEAARSAKGRYLAIMIDGAHVLTPGVFREAANALREMPDGIVAVRQWWLGGDQRWLSSIGYTREMEDILFTRIAWPNDGYKLFRVGAPILESPNAWFDEMAESNCLFVPADLYARLGGMDEGFSEPGAGFANLDLFRRAADAATDRIISLIGEASFHQYHDGTTTNVNDDEKDRRVRAYANHYRDLRGNAFGAVTPDRIHLRGRIRRATMFTARQRPWFTGELGVTDKLRPATAHQHFDPGARLNIQSSYAECELFRGTVWAGRQIRLAPADLVNIQALLNDVRPTVIVTTSRDDGFLHFLNSILDVLGLKDTRIVRVQTKASESPPRVQAIIGAPYEADTLEAVRRAIGAEEKVVVLFEPQRDDYLPIQSLHAYSQFVSFRSYLIFLGTVLGQPWLGYSRYWFAAAIRTFLRENRAFVVDPTPDQQVMTLCVGGYLQRARQHAAGGEEYDASLDYFESEES